MYFEVYQERKPGLSSLLPPEPAAQWRWRLRVSNNEIIASGESYYNKQDCTHAVHLVMSTNQSTPIREL